MRLSCIHTSCLHPSLTLAEEDEEETFETDLKEAGLTIAGAKGSLSISPANLAPSGNNMDPSGEDDLLFSSDYGLSRYRRAAGNNSEDVGSGYGEQQLSLRVLVANQGTSSHCRLRLNLCMERENV